MAKVIPRKAREVKVLYVLYPFDRATTSKGGLHSPLKEVKKRGNGERESCRSASRSHGIRQNLEQNFPSLAFIEKIFFQYRLHYRRPKCNFEKQAREKHR